MASLPGYWLSMPEGAQKTANRTSCALPVTLVAGRPFHNGNKWQTWRCCKVPEPESLVLKAHRNDDRIADLVAGLRIRPKSLPGGKARRSRTALSQNSVR